MKLFPLSLSLCLETRHCRADVLQTIPAGGSGVPAATLDATEKTLHEGRLASFVLINIIALKKLPLSETDVRMFFFLFAAAAAGLYRHDGSGGAELFWLTKAL